MNRFLKGVVVSVILIGCATTISLVLFGRTGAIVTAAATIGIATVILVGDHGRVPRPPGAKDDRP